MPYYEYRCEANGVTLEVRHGMNEELDTWGAVAERAGTEVGNTPTDAPVERLLSAPVPLSASGSAAAFQGCGTSCACGPKA